MMYSEDQEPDTRLGLAELLGKIEEFEHASVGLIAWEFMCDQDAVADVWWTATRRGLLTFVRLDTHTGEEMWTLTSAGRACLSQLRAAGSTC